MRTEFSRMKGSYDNMNGHTHLKEERNYDNSVVTAKGSFANMNGHTQPVKEGSYVHSDRRAREEKAGTRFED